jgi:mannose/cellobiose epimerase-like protein (N-acyl-D-glucosamine 2-epimerase family)
MHRFLALVLLALSCVAQTAPEGIPSADRWMTHLTSELLPFWTSDVALGNPLGAFPSTRCDDGSALDLAKPCPEVARNAWLLTPNRYLVPQSRQTYAYGVAFHMTGDVRYLDYMKAGVKQIRENFMDRDRGGMFTQLDVRSAGGPRAEWRNPQELGYGLLGMAFYYYLTRDPDVLPDILAVKNYIFEKHYSSSLDALQWLLENNGATRAEERRLVAQLDQMNAYLVLLTPTLPEEHETAWKRDMARLSRIMLDQFYSEEQNLFFLNANRPEDRQIDSTGTDFGHSIKAFWMIRHAALINGDAELAWWVEQRALRLLDRAYLPDSGAWAQGVLRGGAIDPDKSWWIYAELDQFSASLGMTLPEFGRYLPKTYDYWLRYFVDPKYGEVWGGVSARTNQPLLGTPKAWQWKNGYHSLEHALVAYITTRQMFGEPVTLYYAFHQLPEQEYRIRPYFYSGRVESIQRAGETQPVWTVTFRDVN